ncbi:hypothetical protein [Streptomyces sp. AD55]|uniref:zinc finger domain-containing protein n=1 Tax=Streptomyces sp. AD55 TaxID=3242895 RepID=UPI0035297081
MSDQYETDAETDTSHLREGDRITLDELAAHLSAVELRMRQLARAAEEPDTPVELEPTITSLRNLAGQTRELAERTADLTRIVEGDVPLSVGLGMQRDPWGAAALDVDREDYGGPAIIPTQWQLLRLATDAGRGETTTYPEAMAGVPRSILLSWESKAAADRRVRERAAAVQKEVLRIECTKCKAERGARCQTSSGWDAEQPHVGRLREARARVDARLGVVGDNPVAVPGA